MLMVICSLHSSPLICACAHSGGNAPSYVYRLLSEYYHEKDYEL